MNAARLLSLLSLLLTLPLSARAQDDARAGLFTQARQLPLVSQSLYVDARGEDAEVRLVQVFHNDGANLGQADYQLHLPEGATVVSFGFWQGERFLEAALKEREEAEARHAQAASEGRATAILKTDAGVQRFSVYPVKAGALQRVEVTLRVPVAREMGRSQVGLAVDRFLGQGKALSMVVVDVRAEEPLADVGVEGARFARFGRSERGARLAFTTEKPVEVWWSERGAPLSYGADAVRLEEGAHAVALRISLNDAGAWRAPYQEVRLYVDASFSMRRRRAALEALVDRVQDQASAPVRLFAVGDTVREQRLTGDAAAAVKALLDGTVGHTTNGATFARAMDGCQGAGVRCVGVTDLQLAGFDAILPLLPSFIFLGDAHERALMEGKVPMSARVYDPEVEALAKLRALADEVVLPVLEVTRLAQGLSGVEPMGDTGRRVAEGGLLRLFFRSTSGEPLEVAAHIEGRQVGQPVPLTFRDAESPEGRAVRRGYFERQLATWMAAYRRSPDPDLKKMIIETSLKEGIPTAFTALQVSSPELSLDAIKPGDPLLTVRAEPGLEEVTAWYPFGEARRLAYDAREGVFLDRFLVPRGWTDRLYAVEVFKRYQGGQVRQERAWYRLDDAGPAVAVEVDAERGVLRVASAEAGQDLGGVRLEGGGGWTRTLSALAGEWLAPLAELPSSFTVVARDRAGNTVHLAFTWERNTLSAVEEPRAQAEMAARTALPREVPALWLEGRGLRLAGDEVRLTVAERELRFPHAEAPLSSLALSALLPLDGGAVLFGTEGGDLIHLTCAADTGRCAARTVGAFPSHPVTGLVKGADGAVWVGVLGEGLHELREGRLERSKVDVGSVYVTGVAFDGRDVVVGTAYNGLWRVTGGRAVRTRFPHSHVLRLTPVAGGVEVASGGGRFLQKGRDRYVALGPVELPTGSAGLMAAARFEGEVYLGGFDSGLWRWREGRAERVALGLEGREAQVNALAAYDEALWVGTEAGLLRVRRAETGLRAERIHEASVHDLSVGPEGLAVATSRGLLVVSEGARVRRVDLQSGVEVGKFFAVTWQGRTLWAGGMDGLYRFEDGRGEQLGAIVGYRGGWVTALLTRGDSVWVGTYASGVYAVREGRASRVPGLEAQWVPLRALKAVGPEVWVGGLGMPPVRVGADGGKRAVHLPTRDVNDVVPVKGGTLLLTTDGALLLPGPTWEEGVSEVPAPPDGPASGLDAGMRWALLGMPLILLVGVLALLLSPRPGVSAGVASRS